MNLYQDLQARGLLKQVTHPELETELAQKSLTLYAGFDPTADTLHVGSLLPIATLRRFQQAGHRILALVGGATGMIGDPSFKSAERQLQTNDTLNRNVAGIRRTLSQFLDLSDSKRGALLNNADWFAKMSALDFLRDIGKHFTVNHMMAKESVRARLEDRDHGISYTEFSYMLLQAQDFLHLAQTEGCKLQIGGSDQWGNITAGTDLVRKVTGQTVFGMTHPLVNKADGTKFGKTEQGTVWLDASRTSPFAFYQFWIQTTDADIAQFFPFFSFRPMEEIREILARSAAAPEKREAQKLLAQEITTWIHGAAALTRAEAASQALFSEDIRSLDVATIQEALQDAPTTNTPRAQLGNKPLIDALVDTGLCASKGAARKDVTAGGVYINNVRATDPQALLNTEHTIADGKITLLRKGKRTYHVLRWEA